LASTEPIRTLAIATRLPLRPPCYAAAPSLLLPEPPPAPPPVAIRPRDAVQPAGPRRTAESRWSMTSTGTSIP